MPLLPKIKTRRRYSIGEWYGRGFETLTPSEWKTLANREIEVDAITGQACPFQPNGNCNKKGGVCSLRLYETIGGQPVAGKGPIITTCPTRFLEAGLIFDWVGRTILQTENPIVLDEIGFLDRFRPEAESDDEEDSRDYIGRIDNVLVHPDRTPLEWCALELQAVYFSGKAMKQEFKMLASEEHPTVPFPAAHRRPDWRSSGPKRLLPQLQTKVPTIRTWGKKMAVVVDEAFFESLSFGLEREKHLSNAEIAWFVVKYESTPTGWKLSPREVVFTKLDASVKALTGGVPLPLEKFEAQLRQKLRILNPMHPLVRH